MGPGARPSSDRWEFAVRAWARDSAMSSSACSLRWVTRATRCGSCSSTGFAPTHAFSAFYRYLREDFGADAILHFGTHGALEFMPGKQVGLSASCWPDRLIGQVPNLYLYAANNPSEGALAKRRSAATLVSYLTPSLAQAGLYRGLVDLKASIDRYRVSDPVADEEARDLWRSSFSAQAAALDLAQPSPIWGRRRGSGDRAARASDPRTRIHADSTRTACCRRAARAPKSESRRCSAIAETSHGLRGVDDAIRMIVAGSPTTCPKSATPSIPGARCAGGACAIERPLAEDHEIPALLRALDGRFVAPVVGRRPVAHAVHPADRAQSARF